MGPVNDETTTGGFRPGTREGARAFVISPFSRMARTHGVAAMADAMVAASLAGSLFFAAPGGEARGPVFRYLVITMLPFALLSPLIGPLIDRMHGGHRLMVIASAVLRGIACWFMATTVNDGNFQFFLYALMLLVFQKAYAVARSALVPTLVRTNDELVKANSRLALVSGVASVVGVVPAGLLIKLFGAQWSLRLAMIVYVVAAVMALRITAIRVAEDRADPTERIELRGATIFMAGSAMGLVRGAVGFMMFLIAFSLSDGGKPTFAMGVVGGALAAFQQVGNLVAPKIRSFTNEENLLTGVLALIVGCGIVSLLLGEVTGGLFIGGAVGFAAAAGKLAFDSILQRDAPDANRGRAFAKFETKFQIFWVVGAAIPVGLTMSATTGYVIVLLVAVFALGAYALARASYAHRTGASQTIATARAAALDARIGDLSSEVKGRLAAMPRAAFRRLRVHAAAERTGRGRAEHGAAGAEDAGWDDEAAWDDDEGWEDDEEGWGEEDWSGEWVAPVSGPAEDADAAWPADDRDTAEVPVVSPDAATRVDRAGHEPTEVAARPRRGRRRGPVTEVPDDAPAGGSPMAWDPDEALSWRPPIDERGGRDYLEDLDPGVDHPFPWTPDDPTRPD